MIIIVIKSILVILSVCTIGLLPAFAYLNLVVWNEIIIKYVITCGQHINSFWIMLGLTAIGFGMGSFIAPFTKK